MSAPVYPLINGFKYDWSSIEIAIGGNARTFVGVTELTWSESLEGSPIRGAGTPLMLAETRGEHSAEGSLTMYTKDAMELQAELAAASPTGGWGEVRFPIAVKYSGENAAEIDTAALIGVRLSSNEGGGSQGTDPLIKTYDMVMLQVFENGIPMVANSLVA